LSSDSKKSTEEKIEILKTIIEERPFGFTAMELYKNYKDRHNIGSRNTLKNYLSILLEKGEIQKRIIGNYKVYRSKKLKPMNELFSENPHLQKLMLKLFAAMTKVLKDDLELKGEAIGKEMALTAPMRTSKLFEKFMKKKPLNMPKEQKIKVIQQFILKMRENENFFSSDESELVQDGEELILFIRNSEILAEHAWIIYYVQIGMMKTMANEILNRGISIKVESINEKECKIRIKIE